MYYINIFFLYSIVGYIIEYIMYLISCYEGGILYGFWTPVYGIGALIVLYTYNKFISRINSHKVVKFLCVFLTGFLLLTIIEYIGGILIETFFGETLWDYSDYKYNVGKYIALEMSLLLGLSSIVLVYILRNITNKIVKKIPKFLTWILIILFIIDFVCTVCKHLSFI